MGEKLIEAVRNEKCLYDVKHPDYVKVKLKDSIWKRIAEELGLKDGNEARRAWEKLRNNHRDALRRQKNVKRKSVSGADNIRPWRYQGLMEFLKPHMGNRTNKTNLLEESHDEPSQIHSDSTENESEKIKENYGYRTSSVESQSSELSSTGTGRVHKIKRHKRKMANVSMNPSIEGHEEVDRQRKRTDTSNDFTVNNVKNDPLFHFFMSMYETTKSLPPLSQHTIKTNIFSLVSHEESKHLMKCSPRPQSSNT